MEKLIVIAGYGYVGKAIESALKTQLDVGIVDPIINNSRVYDFNCESVIIAVATPGALDGSCDVTNIKAVLKDTPTQAPVLIKSTISIEGWREIKDQFPEHSLTFSPEFLRAKTATEDFLNQKQVYIGGGNTEYWQKLFEQTINKPSVVVNAEELIVAKQFRNSFLATKVSFFNQINDLCECLDLDYEQVRQVVADDDRIGESHTMITEERGFGGHCFPKDTEALVYSALHHGCSQNLLQEAIKYNKKIRKEQSNSIK